MVDFFPLFDNNDNITEIDDIVESPIWNDNLLSWIFVNFLVKSNTQDADVHTKQNNWRKYSMDHDSK